MICTVIHSFIFSLAKVASTASFWVSFCSTFQLSFGCNTRYYNCDRYGEFIAVVYFRRQKFSFQTYLERKKPAPEIGVGKPAPVSGAGFWRVCLGPKWPFGASVLFCITSTKGTMDLVRRRPLAYLLTCLR